MSGIKDKLTNEDRDVLQMINESRTEPQASDIDEMLAWSDGTRAVHYRCNKLADLGLVSKQKQGDSRLSPVRFDTTELGSDIAAGLSEDDEHESIRERMGEIEDQLQAQRRTYTEVKRRIVEIEDEIEDHDSDLDDIAADVRNLRNYLEDDDK